MGESLMMFRDKLGRPQHKGKYKYGKQTQTITFTEFKEIMESGHFKKRLKHKSYLAFLYWFGTRRSEVYERVKEDFKIDGQLLIIKCPAKKRGKREILKAPISLPYIDLIIDQVNRTRKGRRVWNFSASTAYRIVKRVMPKHYPHFFRLNRAVEFLRDPETNIPEMQAWFGWRTVTAVNSYVGYSDRDLDKQVARLAQTVQRDKE